MIGEDTEAYWHGYKVQTEVIESTGNKNRGGKRFRQEGRKANIRIRILNLGCRMLIFKMYIIFKVKIVFNILNLDVEVSKRNWGAFYQSLFK